MKQDRKFGITIVGQGHFESLAQSEITLSHILRIKCKVEIELLMLVFSRAEDNPVAGGLEVIFNLGQSAQVDQS